MKKLSKLVITQMEIRQVSCYVCAYEEDGRIMELRFEPVDRKSSLGNIYVGQIENVAANIGAAFVQISANEKCYLQLSDAQNAIYTSVRKGNRPLKSGDEILVQISRDAMKGKLPAVTTNLNFTGKYLVLTTGDKKFGLSSKLSNEDRSRLSKWMEEEISRPDKEFGIIVRTNAADASKEEIQKELEYLKGLYQKAAVDGRSRTCFSCVYRTEPFYISAVRDANSRNLEEIVTDIPEISQQISDYLENNSPEEKDKLRFYEDKLLPLYKLHRLETVLEEIQHEKVWLNSGGFLVIQQTEAFVSIDVNSGKFTGKKKMQETYRKINLEAAKEIARQLRLRNLSGIILIDFINMENPDHQDELFHVLQKYLRKLPKQDYEDAIEYFNEYFSDTDEEGQQRLMEELGTPKEAAADLMYNLLDRKIREQEETGEEKKSKKGITLLAVLAIMSTPVTVPLFIAMLAVLLAAAICVVCVIFSDFIAAFSILLVGGKLLLRGLVSFPYSLSGALMITGCGLLGIGCAILLYLLGIYLCKWTGMLLVMLARKIAGKRGKNHEKNK